MAAGKTLLTLLSIGLGAVIGSLLGTFAGMLLFSLIFDMNSAAAEGTKHEIYLTIITFNGAIFGFFLGGAAGFLLGRSSDRTKI